MFYYVKYNRLKTNILYIHIYIYPENGTLCVHFILLFVVVSLPLNSIQKYRLYMYVWLSFEYVYIFILFRKLFWENNLGMDVIFVYVL